MKYRNAKGFTLVEFIAALALLVLLVGVGIPVMNTILNENEETIDASVKEMIIGAAVTAEGNGIPFDEPVREQYRVKTLIAAGTLSLEDTSLFDHWVLKDGNNEYTYLGKREEAPVEDFTYQQIDPLYGQMFAETAGWSKPLKGIEITGYTGSEKELVIPKEIDGQPVVSVWNETFLNNTLDAIYFPDGFRWLRHKAFQDGTLKQLYLPDTILRTDTNTLRGNQLTRVTMPKNLKRLAAHSFSNNNLIAITLPDDIEDIDDYAFDKNSLKKVRFPRSTKRIGGAAFQDNLLEYVILPENVEEIGNNAFYRNQLTSVSIPDSVVTIGQHAFRSNKIEDVRLSATTESYGLYAFHDNLIERLVLPENPAGGVINNMVFRANRLKEVVIPEGYTEIAGGAFQDNFIEEVTLPDSMKTIGNYAFHNNNIKRLNLGAGLEYIGVGGFRQNSIASVEISASLKEVDNHGFYDNKLGDVFGWRDNIKTGSNIWGLNPKVEYR